MVKLSGNETPPKTPVKAHKTVKAPKKITKATEATEATKATKAASIEAARIAAIKNKAAFKKHQQTVIANILREPHIMLENLEFITATIQDYYLNKEEQQSILKYGKYSIDIGKIKRIFHFTSVYSNDNNFIFELFDKRIIFTYNDKLPDGYLHKYFQRNDAITVDSHTFIALFDRKKDQKELMLDYEN
jgi:hypothetical protein